MSLDVYEFLDYRAFIVAKVGELKELGLFSTREFSRKAKLGSNGYLNMIMKGQRDLSMKSASDFARALYLNRYEEDYFLLLLRFYREKDLQKKNEIFEEIRVKRERRNEDDPLGDYFSYFSRWYYVGLREYLPTDRWVGLEISELSREFRISEAKLEEALQVLLRLQLIEKDQQGKYRRKAEVFQTPAEIQNLVIENFHREMIDRALEAVGNLKTKDRNLLSLTLKLSPKDYDQIRSELWKFINRMAKKYSSPEKGADQVQLYQMNNQLFPLLF